MLAQITAEIPSTCTTVVLQQTQVIPDWSSGGIQLLRESPWMRHSVVSCCYLSILFLVLLSFLLLVVVLQLFYCLFLYCCCIAVAVFVYCLLFVIGFMAVGVVFVSWPLLLLICIYVLLDLISDFCCFMAVVFSTAPPKKCQPYFCCQKQQQGITIH